MAGVGTAYVSVRVDTSKFEVDLEKMLSRLSTKMNKAGDQLGKEMVKGLKGADWDSGFKGLETSASKAATNVVKSLDQLDKKLDRVGLTGSDAGDMIGDSLDGARHSATDLKNELSGVTSELTGAKRAAGGINLGDIGGGGGGGASLRSAGDNAGFFRTQLNNLASEATRSTKILTRLFNLNAFGGSALALLVGGLSGAAQGIFALGANAASALPAIGALTNGILSLGQVGATLGLGMQGVGDAISAGFESQKATAEAADKATKGLGDQVKKLVKPAEVSRDAIIAAKEAILDTARGIEDAKEDLRRAYQQAGWAASDAARRTIRAEQELAAAQGATLAAQEALNEARAEAIEQLEDIGFQAEDAALAEQRADIALQDAYAALLAVSELSPDNRMRQEAELAFAEAELNLRQAKDAREDADAAQAEAAATGIEGTEAMTDAKADLLSAQEAEAQAAQDVADAQREQARTTIENAQSIQDAEQGLADARAAHREALQDLIDAQKDYQQALKDAQAAADEANKRISFQNAALAEAPAAVDLFAKAMENLSPSQQEFVKRIIGMHDEYINFRNAIAEPLFDRLLDAMDLVNIKGKDGKSIMDVLQTGLEGTSKALGDTAIKAADLANNDVFQQHLASAMEQNNEAIGNFGGAMVNLADAFVSIADAAGPLFIRFSEWVEKITGNWADDARGDIDGMTETFNIAGDRIAELGDLFGALWDVLLDVGGAASTAANQFKWVDRKGDDKTGFIPMLTDNLKKFHEQFDKTSSIEGFDQSLQTLSAAGRAVKNSLIDPLINLGQDKGIEKAFQILGNKKVSEAMETLSENAGKAAPKLAKIVENVLELAAAMSESGAVEHFLDILKKASGWAADFVGWLGKVKLGPLNDAITKVSDAISWLLDQIGLDTLSDWFDKVDAGGKSLLQLAGYITGAIAAYKILKKVFVITTSPFAGLLKGALDFGKAILKGDIKGALKGLFSKNAGEKSKAKKEGEDITEAFADGIKKGMKHKDAAMKALGKNVRKELEKITAKYTDDAIKVGNNLMEGLEKGITTGKVEALVKATDAGRDVANAIGKGAGTMSPSTITMKDGNDVMEGLELGIKAGTAEAVVAAKVAGAKVGHAVGGSATTAASTSTAGMGTAMSTSATTSMSKSTGKLAGGFTKMLTPLKAVARGFGGLMTLAMGPFGIAIELIILLLPLLIPLFKKLEEKTGIFSKTLEGLKWVFDKVWGAISFVFNWVKDNWPLLLIILTGPIGLAVSQIIKHWDDIKAAVEAAVGFVTDKLTAIWDGITAGWEKIQTFFSTLWSEKIWPPIKGILDKAWKELKDFFLGIIEGYIVIGVFLANLWTDKIWPKIKGILDSAWDKLKGFFGGIIEGWVEIGIWLANLWVDKVKPWIDGLIEDAGKLLGDIWGGIEDGWDTAKKFFEDLWPVHIKPFIDDLVDDISGALSGIWDGMGEGAVAAWNWIAGFVNDKIIGGLNKILGFFNAPEIGFTLPDNLSWTGFAEGGPVRGKGGPKDDRVLIRASPGEYVLPERSSRKLGPETLEYMRRYGQLPPMGDPGIFSGIGHAFSTVADAIGSGAETAAKWTFNKIIDALPDTLMGRMIKGFVESLVDKVIAWATGADAEAAAAAAGGGGADVPVSDPSNPRGITVWKGGVFTRRFVAHMQRAEKLAGVAVYVIQGGFRPATSYSGTSHQGDALDTIVSYALIRALRRVGIAAGDRTGLGDWGPHTHAVPGPSAGYGAGSAIWQWQDYVARGGKNQPLNSTWGLAQGGIVAAQRGGMFALIGEGGRDERVTPLDREGFSPSERRIIELLETRLTSGGDTYQIHPSAPIDEAGLADMVSRRVAWNRRRGARAG